MILACLICSNRPPSFSNSDGWSQSIELDAELLDCESEESARSATIKVVNIKKKMQPTNSKCVTDIWTIHFSSSFRFIVQTTTRGPRINRR